MHITMVKKIKADGSACRKCADVEQRLAEAGYLDRIDQVLIADERDAESEGMQLASKHHVELAPFFLVRNEDGSEQVYTVFFRFLKEVLQADTSEKEQLAELMERNPDLDFI